MQPGASIDRLPELVYWLGCLIERGQVSADDYQKQQISRWLRIWGGFDKANEYYSKWISKRPIHTCECLIDLDLLIKRLARPSQEIMSSNAKRIKLEGSTV